MEGRSASRHAPPHSWQPPPSLDDVTSPQQQVSIRYSYYNAALWGLGNGLISSTLVIYLAKELGAETVVLGVAFILAVPQFVGLLRLAAPAMIDRFARRKQFCIGSYISSALVLFTLPLLAAPGFLSTPAVSLVALVLIWSLYHLLEYLGTVALWSWLADLVPREVRGEFIGIRQRWLLGGGITGMLSAGGFSFWWKERVVGTEVSLIGKIPAEPWVGYALLAALGAAILLLAVWPLARMAEVEERSQPPQQPGWQALLAPLADSRYWRLLAFGCALSFFNGLTQSIQFTYPAMVLGLSLLAMLSLRSTMRLGQVAISPQMGRLADRFGNRPVMIVCQLVVATGPAFYLLATPGAPWWVAGAWLAWIAYAGLNVCLPNLMIKLATPERRAAYIATYFAITGLAYGLSTIAGGWIVKSYADLTWHPFGSATVWDIHDIMFLIGWLGRTASVLLLFWIIEPGAKSWQAADRKQI